jgi:hypothetical protein
LESQGAPLDGCAEQGRVYIYISIKEEI